MRIEYTVVATIDEEALREHVATWREHRPSVDDPTLFEWQDLAAVAGEQLDKPEITGFHILTPASEGES